MTKKPLILPFLLMIASVFIVSCSPISHQSGDKTLSYLAGEDAFDIKFTYEDLKVGDQDEDAYVQEKVQEKNQDEPGEGDKWKKKWYGQREAKLEPHFENTFNDYLEEKNLYASRNEDDANYQLIVAVTEIDPGFYAGPVNSPGYISAELRFVERDNPDEPLSTFVVDRSTMGDADGLYTVAQRLKSSYRSVAVHFGRYVREQSW